MLMSKLAECHHFVAVSGWEDGHAMHPLVRLAITFRYCADTLCCAKGVKDQYSGRHLYLHDRLADFAVF